MHLFNIFTTTPSCLIGLPERRHVEDEYQNLAFPFQPVETPALNMHMMWNLEQLRVYQYVVCIKTGQTELGY